MECKKIADIISVIGGLSQELFQLSYHDIGLHPKLRQVSSSIKEVKR